MCLCVWVDECVCVCVNLVCENKTNSICLYANWKIDCVCVCVARESRSIGTSTVLPALVYWTNLAQSDTSWTKEALLYGLAYVNLVKAKPKETPNVLVQHHTLLPPLSDEDATE